MRSSAEALAVPVGHRRSTTMPDFVLALFADLAVLLFAALILLLAARRLVGALVLPLETWPACGWAGAATLLVLLSPAAGYALGPARRRRIVVAALVLTGAMMLTVPGTRSVVVMLLWLPVLAAIGGLVVLERRRHADGAPRPLVAGTPSAPQRIRRSVPLDARLVSETRRYVDAGGRDILKATLQAPLAAGGRQTVLQLAFTPPFAATPVLHVVAEGAEPAGLLIKTALLLPYGVRLEVKLPARAATDLNVRVQLTAEGPGSIDGS